MKGKGRYCQGVEELKAAYWKLDQMIFKEWLPNSCDCPQPCSQKIFEYHGDSTDDREDATGRVKVS